MNNNDSEFIGGYFDGVRKTRNDLNRRKRELSISLHPNKGGDSTLFKEMMEEYLNRRDQIITRNRNLGIETPGPTPRTPTPNAKNLGILVEVPKSSRKSGRSSTRSTSSQKTPRPQRSQTTPKRTPRPQRSPPSRPQRTARPQRSQPTRPQRTARPQRPQTTPNQRRHKNASPKPKTSHRRESQSITPFFGVAPVVTMMMLAASSGSMIL